MYKINQNYYLKVLDELRKKLRKNDHNWGRESLDSLRNVFQEVSI